MTNTRILIKSGQVIDPEHINKKADVRLPTNEEEDKFISLVKDITSKGFVRSNLKEKLIDLSNVRINLKSKK